MSTPRAPGAVRWIARTLEEAGFETWAVGGAVRDWLSGTPTGDWDLTTKATPSEVQRLFRRTVPLGVEHGTVGVLSREGGLYEVTTFRRDVETTGRHAVVEFSDSLDEDLSRRDFTINAVAWHPLEARLHDPFGGQKDLEARILRTVGEAPARFAEDYLRVLRGLRFAGTFELRVEPETWRALVGAVDQLGILSPERIREELEKVLGGVQPPSRALALYAASGALRRLYPELDAVRGRPRPPGEWFAHTLRTVDLVSRDRPRLRWAALLQALGDGDQVVLEAAAILERLRSSKAHVREVAELVRWVSRPPDPSASESELRRWLSQAGRDALRPLLRVWLAALRADEARGEGPWKRRDYLVLWRRLRAIERSGSPMEVGELAFSGRDLIRRGYRPGPHFGEVLRHLLDRVIEDPVRNEPEWLASEAESWLSAQGGRGLRDRR